MRITLIDSNFFDRVMFVNSIHVSANFSGAFASFSSFNDKDKSSTFKTIRNDLIESDIDEHVALDDVSYSIVIFSSCSNFSVTDEIFSLSLSVSVDTKFQLIYF